MYRGFPVTCIDFVVCQEDGGRLRLVPESGPGAEGVVWFGELQCDSCGARYSIRNGILDLLARQGPRDAVVENERVARDVEADTYDQRFSHVRNAMEIPSSLKGLDLAGKAIVEYGCGTGRFTTRLLPGARLIVAVDFSASSLRVLASKIGGGTTVGLVLADVTLTSLTARAFDIALAMQVLEHVPSAAARSRFFELARASLVDGGVVVMSVYHHDLLRRLRGLPQEGYHPNGIPYHYFTAGEVTAEIARTFRVADVHPIEIQVPIGRRLHLPLAQLSRRLERVPMLNLLGHLLLITAVKSDGRHSELHVHPGS